MKLINDQGGHFNNETSEILIAKFMINHKKVANLLPPREWSSKKHQQGVGVHFKEDNQLQPTYWDLKLPTALWAYWNSYKISITHSLFELVYGLLVFLPLEFLVPSYHMGYGLNYNPLAALMARMEWRTFVF